MSSTNVGAGDVAFDSQSVASLLQLAREAIDVEAEVAGVGREVRLAEGVLVGEEGVVHLPEPALARRGLGGLGGQRACSWT